MISKIIEKNKVIKLRKEGKTYSEIMRLVPVAKSSISLWLKEVGLSKAQKQRITKKRIDAAHRGGEARKQERLRVSNEIFSRSEKDIREITHRELWLIGVALYWAEGSKQKFNSVAQGVKFSNSEPRMIRIYLRWLMEVCKISIDRIHFCIYIHEIYKFRFKKVKKFWSKETGFPVSSFDKIYLKRHTTKTNRKNIGNMYNGGICVVVRRSTALNRQIEGWVRGIVK